MIRTRVKQTMSAAQIRERVNELKGVTPADLKAIERYLARREYRDAYNARPDVKERRKEYQLKRRREEQIAKERIAQLEAELAKRSK